MKVVNKIFIIFLTSVITLILVSAFGGDDVKMLIGVPAFVCALLTFGLVEEYSFKIEKYDW